MKDKEPNPLGHQRSNPKILFRYVFCNAIKNFKNEYEIVHSDAVVINF